MVEDKITIIILNNTSSPLGIPDELKSMVEDVASIVLEKY